MNIKNNNYSEDELIKFMIENNDLIQRPIIEKGNKAVLARPVEKIDELFS